MDHMPSVCSATAGHAPQASLCSTACKDFISQNLPTSVSEGLSATASQASPTALNAVATKRWKDFKSQNLATAGHASPELSFRGSAQCELLPQPAHAGHAKPVLSVANALPSNLKDFNSQTSASQDAGHSVNVTKPPAGGPSI
eukprot:3466418-Karenia_brevis.AAC.1